MILLSAFYLWWLARDLWLIQLSLELDEKPCVLGIPAYGKPSEGNVSG